MGKRLRLWMKPLLKLIDKEVLIRDVICLIKGILLGFLLGSMVCGIASNLMIFQTITDTMMELI